MKVLASGGLEAPSRTPLLGVWSIMFRPVVSAFATSTVKTRKIESPVNGGCVKTFAAVDTP